MRTRRSQCHRHKGWQRRWRDRRPAQKSGLTFLVLKRGDNYTAAFPTRTAQQMSRLLEEFFAYGFATSAERTIIAFRPVLDDEDSGAPVRRGTILNRAIQRLAV